MPESKNEDFAAVKSNDIEFTGKSTPKSIHVFVPNHCSDISLPPVVSPSMGWVGATTHHDVSRHNPHPNRVKHMPGLLGVPICTVNDDGYIANPRYSLTFPPNYYNQTQVQNMRSKMAWMCQSNYRPVTTGHPCSSGSGSELAWSKGKVWRNHVTKERAVPTIGLVPVHEVWQDALLTLTEAVQQDFDARCDQKKTASAIPAETRTRSTQYSAQTGRLIPSSSRRLTSRKQRQTPGSALQPQHVTGLDDGDSKIDMEGLVMQLVGQILQTEDQSLVKEWLATAPERDKTRVLEMLKVAIADAADEQPHLNTVNLDYSGQMLPAIDGHLNGDSKVDRLILEEVEDQSNEEDKTYVNTNPVTARDRKLKDITITVKVKHVATVEDITVDRQYATASVQSEKPLENGNEGTICNSAKSNNKQDAANKTTTDILRECNPDLDIENGPNENGKGYCKVHGRQTNGKPNKKNTKNKNARRKTKSKSVQTAE